MDYDACCWVIEQLQFATNGPRPEIGCAVNGVSPAGISMQMLFSFCIASLAVMPPRGDSLSCRDAASWGPWGFALLPSWDRVRV